MPGCFYPMKTTLIKENLIAPAIAREARSPAPECSTTLSRMLNNRTDRLRGFLYSARSYAKESMRSMKSRTLAHAKLTRYLLRTGWPLAFLISVTGCMFKNRILAQRSVTIEPIEIVTARDLTAKWRGKLGVFTFAGTPYAGKGKEQLSTIYFEKLLKNGPFRETLLLHSTPASDEDALRLGRELSCDAVLLGSIDYLLDSSGATPTALEVHIRVVEIMTGNLLAYFRQQGRSQPGSDVDLYWTVVQGSPAVRLHGLAELLAEQASQQLNSLTWSPFQ